jgi:hypothetical protein
MDNGVPGAAGMLLVSAVSPTSFSGLPLRGTFSGRAEGDLLIQISAWRRRPRRVLIATRLISLGATGASEHRKERP